MAPKQKPGKSKQDYQTPPEFLAAVRKRLGITSFSIDLAASASNAVPTVTHRYISQEMDSLSVSWQGFGGWAWLNPPFAHIEPWVKKAYIESRVDARIAMLLPAGVGSNWWKRFVHQKAAVLLLNGRITFVGQEQGYPKDCVLLLYGPYVSPCYDVWSWTV